MEDMQAKERYKTIHPIMLSN